MNYEHIIRPAFKQVKKVVTFIHKLLDDFSETIKAGSRLYLIYCLLLSTNYLGWDITVRNLMITTALSKWELNYITRYNIV